MAEKYKQQYRVAMVFGVFDGLHPGHRAFLEQAKNVAEKLIVVVTQDPMVEELKKKSPQYSLGQRINAIRQLEIADQVIAGDLVRYSWSAIRSCSPDVIALGYDQTTLQDALESYQEASVQPFDIVVLDPHHPEKYKTSILYHQKREYETSLQGRFEKRIKEKRRLFDKGEYLADFVYGANDGIITTFAVVSGVVGASLSPGIIVALGVANLLADGFSMGASSFLSILSERNFHKSIRAEQDRDIEHQPDIAREEVRSVLKGWQVPREMLEQLVQVFTRDKQRWSNFIMRHEFDVSEEGDEKPFQHGLATFSAFVVAGILPIFPYFFAGDYDNQFLISIIATGITLFLVGSAQSLLTNRKWWLKTGLQMLVVGGVAASISFGVGFLIKTLFGVAL